MGQSVRAFVIVGLALAITLAGVTLTRYYIVAASEEGADRLSRAILEHVIRKNPQVSRELFQGFPRVLLTEARRTGIDHCLALAQAEVESEFRPDAVGASGEVGLYQILPSTAAAFERELGQFRRPSWGRGKRDLGDLADPVVSTRFAMAYLRDIMTRRPTLKEALIEYNGGPGGRHPRYYQAVTGAYVELLEHSELRCRFQQVPQTASLTAFLTRG